MVAPIAFVSNIYGEYQQEWLKVLSSAMPDEQIIPFADLPDKNSVEIAIVAEPDVTDLATLPNLRWIQSLWAGVDNLLSKQALKSIPIVRMIDPQMAETMAEAVLTWTLYLHRNMPDYIRQQREKVWREQPYHRPEKRTIGILGIGALGYVAAQKLLQARFQVIGWSKSEKEFADIETFIGQEGLFQVLRQSDIIVCLLPLTIETRNLLYAKTLSKMKRGASIINFGRGELIRTDDLIRAIDIGHINHAVLDVFPVEPLPQTSPLWEHPGITVLPHISAPTDKETASQVVAQNIRHYRKTGDIPVSVNKTKGY